MQQREREILEQAVHAIAEQALKADELVDEAKAAGGANHPVTVHAKTLRLELLKVKTDLERELETWWLNCTKFGLDVHWVGGLGVSPEHWAQREPAPHGEPSVRPEGHYDALGRWSPCVGVEERGRPVMEFDVFGPRAGPGFAFVTTLVRASGRGVPSDVERLEEALAVALTGRDVTIDLREVEQLGPESIAALSRASAILDGWDSGLLYLLVTRATPVWQELGASSLASAPRVYIDEVGSE